MAWLFPGTVTQTPLYLAACCLSNRRKESMVYCTKCNKFGHAAVICNGSGKPKITAKGIVFPDLAR